MAKRRGKEVNKQKIRERIHAARLKRIKEKYRSPTRFRTDSTKGITRSRKKVRRGDLNSRQLLAFFQDRIALAGLPSNLSLEKISTRHKAAWIADCFTRSNAAFFEQYALERMILPLAINHPTKFAEGLGKNAVFFFVGLHSNVEIFFERLAQANNLEKFLTRLYYKQSIAYSDAKSLGRAVARFFPIFLKCMRRRGLTQFLVILKDLKKSREFLQGMSEVTKPDDPLFKQLSSGIS